MLRVITTKEFSYHGLSNFLPEAEGVITDLCYWCFSTAVTFICPLFFGGHKSCTVSQQAAARGAAAQSGAGGKSLKLSKLFFP